MVRHPGPPLPAACIVGARSSFIDMGQDARPPQLVSPCICIGSKEDAADAEWLRELGVTHVLNVAREAPLAHPAQFFCLKVDLLDNADQTLRPFRDQTAAFMRNVEGIGGRVLVHCVAGCSRSVSVVITHLMAAVPAVRCALLHGLCLRTALAHIRRHRSLAYPNQAFLYELAVMETERSKTDGQLRWQIMSRLRQIFKASSVNRGVIAEFNFYKWNKIKRQYRHHCPEYDSSGCCSVQ
ncbi:protein-tyrosine phosphatase-like protein [Tribonema minus]|uniref:protein-tyrosine-phosphatase n=1 Tax=Tribonema minus TaxID=303371 RepID=A0A835ZC85_9STRA|nr:protein-tyrosine phosphatase-like protein [Tribonema minus]